MTINNQSFKNQVCYLPDSTNQDDFCLTDMSQMLRLTFSTTILVLMIDISRTGTMVEFACLPMKERTPAGTKIKSS